MGGTCVTRVTCVGYSAMTREGGGAHRKVCRDTCRDTGKLLHWALSCHREERKLRNKESAQTSRDRQKSRIAMLESAVQTMQTNMLLLQQHLYVGVAELRIRPNQTRVLRQRFDHVRDVSEAHCSYNSSSWSALALCLEWRRRPRINTSRSVCGKRSCYFVCTVSTPICWSRKVCTQLTAPQPINACFF